MVTPTFRRETAKIYEFPRKLVRSGGEHRTDPKLGHGEGAQHAPVIQVGSSWYHDAAIQEAYRTPKA